jgi:hypothetical protein
MRRSTSLCYEIVKSDEGLEWNAKPIETDQVMVFDPDFTLCNIESGFRIFAFEEVMSPLYSWVRLHKPRLSLMSPPADDHSHC